MRLICGIAHLDGASVHADSLASMVSALTAPGLTPAVTRKVEGPAALAVLHFGEPARTSVGDLPRSADGTWLSADCRLDRPGELAISLALPVGTDEGALVLGALARWGDALPDRLDGDFALAAWNPRERRLCCARDIMGVRPLCYVHRPGRLFAFASLPRGLHASGIASRRLDPIALGRLLVESSSCNGLTGFAEISWLPAGNSLTVTPTGVRVHQAWQPAVAHVGTWSGSAAEAAATLRTLIEEAVASRLPPAGPVAAHLSGGLDSSSIAVIANRRLRGSGRSLHAFSLLARPMPEMAVQDEREYVDAVLTQEPDIRWSPAYLPPLDEDGVHDPDLPMAGPMMAPDNWICAAAADAGSHLVLSGAGGDESATYNGVSVVAALLRQGRWRAWSAALRARARRTQQPLSRVIASQLLVALQPEWLETIRCRRRGQSSPDIRRRNALSFLNSPLAVEVAAALTRHPDWRNRPQDRIQMLNDSYLVGRGDGWSILGARHGIAFSYPLLDRRVVDFVLSLPLERFQDGGFSRQPFRNAMAGILPESIRWRESKFVPFPDMPMNLAATAAGLLARVQPLRHSAVVADMFNMDAISRALSELSQDVVSQRSAFAMTGQERMPRPFRMAWHAQRAQTLAGYVARMT